MMEVSMFARRILISLFTVLFIAGTAAADLKVVKMTHRDGFTVMGQTQPAEDQEQTTWIGDGRMLMEQGANSTIVRLDTKKLIVVDHQGKSFSVLDLPINLDSLMPAGMAEQMKVMMTFEVTVTPADESKTVGEWTAQRYEMKMTSKMMSMESTMWATTHPAFDQEAYFNMAQHMANLQPGMADVAKEMHKVKGLVVEQEGVMTMTMMGDISVKTSEKTSSIEKLDPPAGIYDPPAGYTEKPFDLMAQMQK
jgi:hypothetical protein